MLPHVYHAEMHCSSTVMFCKVEYSLSIVPQQMNANALVLTRRLAGRLPVYRLSVSE